MQIFEVIELKEFPFMETKEVAEGTLVREIISNGSNKKAFLIVDHDTKRIWTYNEPQSSLKIQIYGGILAGMLRQQLRLFYRVYPLNMYSITDSEFQEIIDKQLGAGRAKPIEKKDFSTPVQDKYIIDVSSPNFKKAIEYISQFPQPENLLRRFMIIGGQIFTDEEITESFLLEEKKSIQPKKLGQLNNGFTFFKDHNYSTRLIIKDRKIQCIELYVEEKDQSPSLELQIPVIYEEKFSKSGSINTLIDAFQIPDKMPEETEAQKEKDIPLKDDSTNQSKNI
ncbi:MAG: hypothetical protein ACXAB8_14660 [Promethearchaeota archaeon]|jgi:hypothetical protein